MLEKTYSCFVDSADHIVWKFLVTGIIVITEWSESVQVVSWFGNTFNTILCIREKFWVLLDQWLTLYSHFIAIWHKFDHIGKQVNVIHGHKSYGNTTIWCNMITYWPKHLHKWIFYMSYCLFGKFRLFVCCLCKNKCKKL